MSRNINSIVAVAVDETYIAANTKERMVVPLLLPHFIKYKRI
jgi:hypothetical protein